MIDMGGTAERSPPHPPRCAPRQRAAAEIYGRLLSINDADLAILKKDGVV